jgi:hypothetical protein
MGQPIPRGPDEPHAPTVDELRDLFRPQEERELTPADLARPSEPDEPEDDDVPEPTVDPAFGAFLADLRASRG